VPQGCPTQLVVAGKLVGLNGSMTVKPVLTTTYRLNFAINPTAILSSIQVKVVIPSINDDDPTAEYDLTSGRITKLPVSWFFTTKLIVAGAHNLIFRSNCTDADSDAGRCDTGLLVWVGSNTYYNDDDPLPAAHGNGKRGSYIQIPPRNQSKEYSIALFSRIRATSFTTLYYNLDNGIAWQRLSSPMEVGEILVKVGSLLSGDGLEVATHTNGSGNDDTQMILFNPESQIKSNFAPNHIGLKQIN
jgi:hypothetical protein